MPLFATTEFGPCIYWVFLGVCALCYCFRAGNYGHDLREKKNEKKTIRWQSKTRKRGEEWRKRKGRWAKKQKRTAESCSREEKGKKEHLRQLEQGMIGLQHIIIWPADLEMIGRVPLSSTR